MSYTNDWYCFITPLIDWRGSFFQLKQLKNLEEKNSGTRIFYQLDSEFDRAADFQCDSFILKINWN